MQVFHLALNPGVLFIALMVHRVVTFLSFILGVGSREARIDILRDDAQLFVSASGKARQIRLFKGAILVQCTADKVGAVWKIMGVLVIASHDAAGLDTLNTPTALLGGDGGVGEMIRS